MTPPRRIVLCGLLGLCACASVEPRGVLPAAEEAFREGRYPQAERLGRAALAASAQARDQAGAGEAAGFLAGVETLEGRSAQADGFYRQALAYDESSPERAAAAAATAYDLAGAMTLEGKSAEAETFYLRAVALSDKPGVSPGELFERLGGLALFYETQSRFADAERYYRRAATVAARLGGDYPAQARADLDGLAARKTRSAP